MIQVLIVDDDVHSTEGVKQAVDWLSLGVTDVFTANSAFQAQAVLAEHPVDILFLDIEMPKQSGFEFLRWAGDEGYDPVVIMLTSYANFDYAREAIAHRCLDYLLKPSSVEELTGAARKAVEEVLRRRMTDTEHTLAGYWQGNEGRRVSMFWRALILHPDHFDEASIRELASEMQIELDERNRYLPVLVQFIGGAGKERFRNFERDFSAAAGYEDGFGGAKVASVQLESGFLVIRTAKEDHVAWREHFGQAAAAYERDAQHLRDEKTAVYVGAFDDIFHIGEQYGRLLKASMDNVSERPGVFYLDTEADEAEFRRPDTEAWRNALLLGDSGKLLRDVEWYIDEGVLRHYWNRERLRVLQQELMRCFYVAAEERGIPADTLTVGRETAAYFDASCDSIQNFKKWLEAVVSQAAGRMTAGTDDGQVVKQVKLYVKAHLAEEIGREDVARACFLSPDYVSRVFRQETGVKLSDYITDKRMERARSLLKTTELPIGEVADRCGYGNLAYFSRVFRIRNGTTPAEFRSSQS